MEKNIPDPEQDFAMIGRFHDFDLTDAELKAFEERLENDPIFQERFHLYGEMEQHIEQELPKEATSDFRQIIKEEKKGSGAKVRRLFSPGQWSMAATIALLLVAGMWWLLSPSVLEDPVALADYYWDGTQMEHLFSGDQRGADTRDPLESAHTFFRTIRDYHENGEYATMIDQLEIYKVTTPAPIPFEDDADWLLAIAYIANHKLENAKFVLEQIIEAYPARREKARQLLLDIEQLEAVGEVKK